MTLLTKSTRPSLGERDGVGGGPRPTSVSNEVHFVSTG